jgi:hypothetical protein
MNGNAIGIYTLDTRVESRWEGVLFVALSRHHGGYMKTAEESPSGNGAEFPGYPEDQRHDEESCSRMDSEGCPNGGTEGGGVRAAERAKSCGTVTCTPILV